MTRLSNFFPIAVALLIGGCARDFPYEVMLLEGDMEPVVYGKPVGLETFDVEEFPVQYVLRRTGYSVHAAIDKTQLHPTVVFWATDALGNPLSVTGESIKCVAAFRPLLDTDPMKREFPFATQRLLWLSEPLGPCSAIDPNQARQNDLVLKIGNDSSKPVREIIAFRIVRNGTYRLYDGI